MNREDASYSSREIKNSRSAFGSLKKIFSLSTSVWKINILNLKNEQISPKSRNTKFGINLLPRGRKSIRKENNIIKKIHLLHSSFKDNKS